MKPYGNKAGKSDILAYEVAEGRLSIVTNKRWLYLYTEQSVGPEKLRLMQELAERGEGLGSYMWRVVPRRYAGRRELEEGELVL
ncbi:MAG TPA: hypothetical protein VFW42_09750 [Fluviicoccus sp.]|nr:hypothetical protein [Fluviicoccus sp.]